MAECRPAPAERPRKSELSDEELDKRMQTRFECQKKRIETQETYYAKFKKILTMRQVEKIFAPHPKRFHHAPHKAHCAPGNRCFQHAPLPPHLLVRWQNLKPLLYAYKGTKKFWIMQYHKQIVAQHGATIFFHASS